jgi:hypothetical protein
MKAFAFRSSKKSQQQSQSQPRQPQQQRSRTNFQLSLSLSKARTSQDQPRHEQIPTPSMTPSPIPSPTHSTISFGAISAGSLGAAHTRGPKPRPSLTMLRPLGFYTVGSEGHGQFEQRTRSPLYSRFGFNRSTPQLPPRSADVDGAPLSAKTPVFLESNSRPPIPTRPTPLPPPPPQKTAIPLTNQTDASPRLIELSVIPPPVPSRRDSQIPRQSPGRPNRSIDGLEVPLENGLSTSTLLQRRRAKSLGPTGNGGGEEGSDVGPRITNLVIPPLVIDQTPLNLQPGTPTSISPTLSLPTPMTPGGPLLGPSSAPLQSRSYLTYPHFHSPSPATSRSQSPAYRHRSESSASRARSESHSSSRTRSESNSSRARSESNASNSSSSRHGHRSKRASVRATMNRLDDMWSDFLKEVDEDLAELSGTKGSFEEGKETSSNPLTPSETIKGSLVNPIPPLRSQTPTTSTTPKPVATHGLSKSSSKIVVTISPSPSSENIGGVSMKSRDSDSSLPYLRTPETSFDPSPDPNTLQPHGPLKHSVPPPVMQMVGSQSPQLAQLWQPDKNSNRISIATLESEDSRPGSSYSQMSQFSLSMFPSPPSVPVIRPTTENGTFRIGPVGSSNDGHGDGTGIGSAPGNAKTIRFKPIVQPSGPGRSLIKSLFFAKDKESASESSGSRTATPSRSATPTPSDPGLPIWRSDSSEASAIMQSRSPTPNYDALLKSMESRKIGEPFQPSFVSTGNTFPQAPHSLFDVGTGGSGNGASRPGTADSKFQWGYAL